MINRIKFRTVLFIIIMILTLGIGNIAIAEGSEVGISINGDKLESEIKPFIDKESSRTLVPIRLISEALGCTVDWDAEDREIKISKEETIIKLIIGEKVVEVNGETIKMDTQPCIKNGTTFVPVSFIGEAMGHKVEWNSESRTVEITTNDDKGDDSEDDDFIEPVFKLEPNDGGGRTYYFYLIIDNWKEYDDTYQFKVESPTHPKLNTRYYYDYWNSKEFIYVEYNKFIPMRAVAFEMMIGHYLEKNKESAYKPDVGDDIDFIITIKNDRITKTYDYRVKMMDMK